MEESTIGKQFSNSATIYTHGCSVLSARFVPVLLPRLPFCQKYVQLMYWLHYGHVYYLYVYYLAKGSSVTLITVPSVSKTILKKQYI